MAMTTTAGGPLAQQKDNSLAGMLRRMGPQIALALPKHVNADRMARIALTALNATPKLGDCTPGSFLGSVIQASQLGLEVNTPLGHAYLIPYGETCQLIVGYQGFIELAMRSGSVSHVQAFCVYDGDEFTYELGLNPTISHKPGKGAREAARMTHVYAVAKLKNGEPIFTVLSRAEVDKYRKRSRASGSGPWVTDYEAMSMKTAVRRLFKWLPKSAEMAVAASVDEAAAQGRNQLAAVDPEVLGVLQQGAVEYDATETAVDADGESVEPIGAEDFEALLASVECSENKAQLAEAKKAIADAEPRMGEAQRKMASAAISKVTKKLGNGN